MKTRLPILLLVIVLIASSLACQALSSEPTVSNFYMATDTSGGTKVSTYSSSDDFFVFFDVKSIKPGTQFEARWFILDIADQDPNTPIQTINYPYEKGVSSVYFQLTSDLAWPVSRYRVDVYMDGVKVGEQQFNVQ